MLQKNQNNLFKKLTVWSFLTKGNNGNHKWINHYPLCISKNYCKLALSVFWSLHVSLHVNKLDINVGADEWQIKKKKKMRCGVLIFILLFSFCFWMNESLAFEENAKINSPWGKGVVRESATSFKHVFCILSRPFKMYDFQSTIYNINNEQYLSMWKIMFSFFNQFF